MDVKQFNYLLKTENKNKASKGELCKYIVSNAKRRLVTVYGILRDSDELDDLAHGILVQFLEHKPEIVYAHFKYVNKVIDNFMASYFKKKKADLPLNEEITYEQRFTELEKFELYSTLLKILDERSAKVVYYHYVEKIEEHIVAKMLKISYENTRAIASRALKKLRKIYPTVTE